MESIGKPARDLHAKIVSVVEAEERRKTKDFSGRLLRELEFPMYVTPLAILSTESYNLELSQLMTSEVLEYTSSITTIALRDYKQFISSKGRSGGAKAFFKSFVDAFVKKYC